MKITEKDDLHAIIHDANRKLRKIEDAENFEKLKHFVGGYFKFKNSYSCPQKQSDYWFVYSKVVKLEGRFLEAHSFQIDKYGETSFKKNKYSGTTAIGVRIKKSEYLRVLKRVHKKLSDFTRAVK